MSSESYPTGSEDDPIVPERTISTRIPGFRAKNSATRRSLIGPARSISRPPNLAMPCPSGKVEDTGGHHIMTIHLTKELESDILAAVHSGRYASLDDAMCAAASLLIERLKQEKTEANQPETAPAHKPIWEEIEDLTANIPDEEFLKLPVDGAEQLDHYIYGLPKRPSSQ